VKRTRPIRFRGLLSSAAEYSGIMKPLARTAPRKGADLSPATPKPNASTMPSA
jgi:hypothetical protein